MSEVLKDSSWVRRSFGIQANDKRKYTLSARHAMQSSAVQKYYDTTIGGNISLNAPPQFTDFADPPVMGRFSQSYGLGRYYSEAIDDSATLMFIRAGVPRYAGMIRFFTSFFNYQASFLARTGREPNDIFWFIGRAAGMIMAFPMKVVIWVGQGIKWIFGLNTSSKYYSLKPAMLSYWTAVQNIVNSISVSLGLVPPWANINEINEARQQYGEKVFLTDSEKAQFHQWAPRIYNKHGLIDVYRVALQGQLLYQREAEGFEDYVDKVTDRSALVRFFESFSQPAIYYADPSVTSQGETNTIRGDDGNKDRAPSLFQKSTPRFPGLEEYRAHMITSPDHRPLPGSDDVKNDDGAFNETMDMVTEDPGFWDTLFESTSASTSDGAEFVCFNVRSNDSYTESFSNSASESEIASTINGMTTQGRKRYFNFSGGALGFGLEKITESINNVIGGLLQSVELSGLMALNGAAWADIPLQVDGSSVSLPRFTVNLELRAPYNHPMSRLQNEFLPLAMWLALAMPRATGKQSYRDPFIVEAYFQGRKQCRLGLVDSLTIERGVCNLPWTRNGIFRGINISATIMDLTSVMTMPLNAGPDMFDEDNVFSDYMATLGSMTLSNQIYGSRRIFTNLARKYYDFTSSFSTARTAISYREGNVIPLIGQVHAAFKRGIQF